MNFFRQAANFFIFTVAILRTKMWGMVTASMGNKTFLREGCLINHPAGVRIGSNVYIGRYCEIDGFGGVTIGDDVHIASFCAIYSSNHKYDAEHVPIRKQGYIGRAVVIEDNVWIGSHVVILAGVTIHRGAIVGAGSVVSRDVGENSVVAGVPARLVKHRFDSRHKK